MQSVIDELHDLNIVLQSPVLKKILADRKHFIRREIEEAILNQDWYNAYAGVKRLKDIDKLLDLAQEYYLTKQKEAESGKGL
jgi:hypothetical protein